MPAAPSTPVSVAVGAKTKANDVNQVIALMTASTTFAPNLTNWSSATISPTTIAYYNLSGLDCNVQIFSTLGTGTIVVGNITGTLPVPAFTGAHSADITPFNGTLFMNDVSATQEYAGSIRFVDANTFRLERPLAAGLGAIGPITNVSPFTWAAGDAIAVAFSYAIG